MKVLFDTNIYINWIREKKHSEVMLDVYTQKYLSNYVLMELWAGTKTKQASRIIEKLQKPYLKAGRVITLNTNHFITIGQILSDIPSTQKSKIKNAGFINDLCIGLSALAIGAKFFTTNKSDFKIITSYLPQLKIVYI